MTDVRMPLSNVQLELIKTFSTDISDSELLELKNLIANYFAQKAIKEADRLWDERGYTNEKMNSWLKEKS